MRIRLVTPISMAARRGLISRWPISSGGGLQSRRGWCNSSTGFQHSFSGERPPSSVRTKADPAHASVRASRFGRRAISSGISVERYTPVFQAGVERALLSCPSISFHFTRREIPVSARTSQASPRWFNSVPPRGIAIGLQTLTVKSRLLTGENSVRIRGNPPISTLP